ncbi:MAG: hypothetical protein PUB21_11885 [Bacteroidales bacterium]|nr:hypothetical protein [Bacteroidales bacterium]
MTTTSNTQNFSDVFEEMKLHGMKTPTEKVYISLSNAEDILRNALRYFLSLENREMQWLPEYEKVANWLENNCGRGIFLYGNCGRGKTILCRYAIPAILLKYTKKVVSVFDIQDINKDIDNALSKHILSLDDIGTEELSVKYGEKRMAFAEIIDAAEKNGKLLIISTNLGESDLRQRYGDRVFDRIKSTTTRVLFNGPSLRQ